MRTSFLCEMAKRKPLFYRAAIVLCMKLLLQAFAYLSLFGGIGLGVFTFMASTDTLGSPTTGAIFGATYFISGLAGFALFGGMAEILERLETRQ
jgi:hypothetical protein